MTGAAPPLLFDCMTRRFGETLAVDGLSLTVEPGEMFGLIGPDGAGKTTSLRVALGLLAADGGRVSTCGFDPLREHRELTRRVGYISQRFSLYGDLTVDENIAFQARIHGVAGWRERRRELLDLVRLTPFRDRLADRLSGGMRQKLALAATLVHRPQLLVLDEPTTGVDPVSRREFWKLLARLQREGMTVVLTTPYLDEAERCQRVALLDHGHLLALDSPQDLKRSFSGAVAEILARPRRRAAEILSRRASVGHVEIFGERLHVTLEGVPADRAGDLVGALRREVESAGVDVESARLVPPTLEDVFIARIRVAETAGAAPASEEIPS